MTCYNSYTGFPYKHLGDDIKTGIDCFNLCRLVYKEKLNIEIDYDTSHFCKIVDEDWYTKTHERYFEICGANTEKYGWKKVTSPKLYDIITMSLGSTHVTNHCALYVDTNRILQTICSFKYLYYKSF